VQIQKEQPEQEMFSPCFFIIFICIKKKKIKKKNLRVHLPIKKIFYAKPIAF